MPLEVYLNQTATVDSRLTPSAARQNGTQRMVRKCHARVATGGFPGLKNQEHLVGDGIEPRLERLSVWTLRVDSNVGVLRERTTTRHHRERAPLLGRVGTALTGCAQSYLSSGNQRSIKNFETPKLSQPTTASSAQSAHGASPPVPPANRACHPQPPAYRAHRAQPPASSIHQTPSIDE
jgi:hypothetical protein